MSEIKKSGFVAIVGRPNVGKSTLLNCILGEKISITSPKPQTTRWQILGIKTTDHTQTIYIDTPGVHRGGKHAMNRYMNRVATSVVSDTDVIVFVVDATSWRSEDELVLSKLQHASQPIILVLNKIDLIADKNQILPLIEKMQSKHQFASIVPLSAQSNQNVQALETEISQYLPDGGLLFPEDQKTDKNIRFQMAEIIREKLIKATEEELPYTTSVMIEDYKDEEKIAEIAAVIWVERTGQKIIVIGKGGARLKQIGSAARRELEVLLKKKVFLRLWVKVKENWTDDDKALRTLGYE